MTTLTLRTIKGSRLTFQEMDDNLSNLNQDKYESGDDATFNTLGVGATGLEATIDAAGNLSVVGLTVGGSPLGTAAYEDVTTSDTDTTAGRLLKVGDFGVGGKTSAILITDLDAAANTRYFGAPTSGWINYPAFGSWSAASGINFDYDGNQGAQLLFSRLDEKIAARRKLAGSWQPWREVYHQGTILGTVSQSAGVPTGALMEYGSNANGEYWKYAGGMMICTASYSASLAITTAALGGFRSGSAAFSFASTFAATPSVSITPESITAMSVGANSISTTGAGINFWAGTSQAAATREARIVAIGRWF